MAKSKYFPDLENGVDDADVGQVEEAFSMVEQDMNKKLEEVGAEDIVSKAVTSEKIADNAVTKDKIPKYEIPIENIDVSSVASGLINADSTLDKKAFRTINADEAITVNKPRNQTERETYTSMRRTEVGVNIVKNSANGYSSLTRGGYIYYNPESGTRMKFGDTTPSTVGKVQEPVGISYSSPTKGTHNLIDKIDKSEVVEKYVAKTDLTNTLKDYTTNDTLSETLKDYTKKSDVYPTNTISDYPIHITDHLEDESVIDYKVYGNSMQDGTPTPEIPIEIQSVGDLITDETSEYYGKYDIPITVVGKNLIPYPYANTTITKNGITFTDNGDGTVTANGTATSRAQYIIIGSNDNYILPVGTYILSGCPSGGSIGTYSIYSSFGKEYGNGISRTVSGNEKFYINITIESGATVSNLVFKPQLELGTAATEYELYSSKTVHIYLDEPLRKVGDYADYVDFQSQKTIRQVEVLDDTGTTTIAESFGILATPTEESIIAPELTAPNSENMNISANTVIEPSKIEVEYWQDVKKVIRDLQNAILSLGGNT